MRYLILILSVFTLSAGSIDTKKSLRDVKSIDDAVFHIAAADQIRKMCPDISARLFKALNFARKTKAKAVKLGYSEAEIDAYLDSDAEKARMKARGAAYFKANGVVTGEPESYCALGRKEIEKSSRIGSLLRVK